MDTKGQELVSVITVVLNGGAALEKTILSVLEQTYPGIEHIVIDGGSTDGTLDIIKKYEKRIARWVSGKDAGIYDAMNKGIALARGEVLYFLNCGDALHQKDVIERVMALFGESRDVGLVYGRNEYVSDEVGVRFVFGKKIDYGMIWKGLPVSHQAIFFRKRLFDILGGYDTGYRVVADQEFMMRFDRDRGRHGYGDLFTDMVVARVSLYGYNAKDLMLTQSESRRVSEAYFGRAFGRELYFLAKAFRYALIGLFIRMGLMDHYRRLKYHRFRRDK